MSFKYLTSSYFQLLPFAVIPTTVLGFEIGYSYSRRWNNLYNPHIKFTCIMGFTSIGILTGITYPISFPILALYTFFKIK
jgi:hypothetical protein